MTFRGYPAFVSDAPLRSEYAPLTDGSPALWRRIDEPWREDPRVQALFLAEREASQRVPRTSVNLEPGVTVEEGGDIALVRRFSTVGTLSDRLARGPALSGGELLTIAGAVLEAFAELDALGLVHGDPIPRNVLLWEDGSVRLCDPASTRRLFAEPAKAVSPSAPTALREEARQEDRAIFATWFETALREAAPDAITARFRQELDVAEGVERKFVAIDQLARHPQAIPRRVGVAAPSRIPREFPPPMPLDVIFRIGPISDPRVAYRQARALAGLAGEPLVEFRRRLETSTFSLPLAFTREAQDLLSRLEADGVPFSLEAASEATSRAMREAVSGPLPIAEPQPVEPAPPLPAPAAVAPARRPASEGGLAALWGLFADAFSRLEELYSNDADDSGDTDEGGPSSLGGFEASTPVKSAIRALLPIYATVAIAHGLALFVLLLLLFAYLGVRP